MYLIQLDWLELKNNFISKGFIVNYKTIDNGYDVYVQDRNILWNARVKTSSDKSDFEGSYKDTANPCLYSSDGKLIVRSESKQFGSITNFAIAGDTSNEVGGDEKWFFDWNNENNDVANPPSGYKQKKLEFSFIDPVWLKEGTIYWENMPFGSFVDLCFAVPPNGYYYANSGEYAGQLRQNLTGSNLIIHRFSQSPMMGSAPMGDELNTEAASDSPLPVGTVGTILITVPNTVTTEAHCAIRIELNRLRSIVLG